MIAIRIIAFVLSLFIGSDAQAYGDTRDDREEQEEREAWEEEHRDDDILSCQHCRNLDDFPIDGANFSLNQVWGPESWMTLEQADNFRIRDRFGNIFYVDLNLDLEMLGLPVPGLNMPLFQNFIPYPTDLYIQVRLRDSYYRLVHNDTIRPSDVSWPLPVGDGDGGLSDPDGGGDEDEEEDVSGEVFDDDSDYSDDWTETDLNGEECDSCSASFDANLDGELDRDEGGRLIEYEL